MTATPATPALAARRPLVRLADGRAGRLVWVTPRSSRAKVVVGGRRVWVAADELELI